MEYKIVSPSYKRAEICSSHKVFPNLLYIIDESELLEYEAVYRADRVMVVPPGVQGNLCRVMNWIMDQWENVLIVDDDYSGIGFHGLQDGKPFRKMLNPEEVDEFIEWGFNLAYEFGCHFWGINLSGDKGLYREYSPYSLSNYIGGPFRGHIGNECRYDERLGLKDDYDMSLQVLNKYRKALRINNYHYICDQHGIEGGCSSTRTMSREKDQNEILLKKWGSDIVRADCGSSQVRRKKEISYDINPIIKVPINGI